MNGIISFFFLIKINSFATKRKNINVSATYATPYNYVYVKKSKILCWNTHLPKFEFERSGNMVDL